jgi:hypothetical protein
MCTKNSMSRVLKNVLNAPRTQREGKVLVLLLKITISLVGKGTHKFSARNVVLTSFHLHSCLVAPCLCIGHNRDIPFLHVCISVSCLYIGHNRDIPFLHVCISVSCLYIGHNRDIPFLHLCISASCLHI